MTSLSQLLAEFPQPETTDKDNSVEEVNFVEE